MVLYLVWLSIGFLLLIEGANLLLNGSVELAKKHNISEIIIGLTIVAFGTSAPELSVSIIGTLRGTGNIAVGDVLGSNILNIGLVLGITGLFLPISIKKQTLKFDLPVCILVTLILPLFLIGNIFSRIEGLLYLASFLFILFCWYKNRHAPIIEKAIKRKYSNRQIVLYIIIGIIGLALGGELTVRYAVRIARKLNIPETTIAITIIAVGTSLPELVTSLIAVTKKKADLSIGNIIGSNIFNLMLCLGLAGIVKPYTFNLSQNLFTISAAIYFPILLFFLVLLRKKLSRIESSFLLVSYVVYIIILL